MNNVYSTKEFFLRLVWLPLNFFLFQCSPRHLYSWRNFLLRLLGAKIGKGVKIYPSAEITFPWLLEVGERSVISWKVRVYNLGKISIGERTVISQFTHLCGGTHDFNRPGFKLLRKNIIIGSGVWIAADAFIGPDVQVGDNAIIGARAVVVKNVQPGSIVAGNPAKSIGERGTL